MLLNHLMVALSLTWGIFAEVPPGKVILGYRAASKDEADRINAAGRPVWDAGVGSGGRQLGEGVYTSQRPGVWETVGPSWYCVIYVDREALFRVSKIWVPYFKDGTLLWWTRDGAREKLVTDWRSDWDPKKTLYFSEIDSKRGQKQLLIPPGLVADEGALGLSATCVEFYSQLPDDEETTWDGNTDLAWVANSAGHFDRNELRRREDSSTLS